MRQGHFYLTNCLAGEFDVLLVYVLPDGTKFTCLFNRVRRFYEWRLRRARARLLRRAAKALTDEW